jgi:hypothetical protein
MSVGVLKITIVFARKALEIRGDSTVTEKNYGEV